MALQTGERLGAYEIVSLLGHGAMGEVYRARDTRLDRFVAIKVLSERYAHDGEVRRRFKNEGLAAARGVEHVSIGGEPPLNLVLLPKRGACRLA